MNLQDPPKIAAHAAATNTAAVMRVLVIDDSNTIRRSAEIFLKQGGHQVVLAEDGFDALAKLSDYQPDLVFCDMVHSHFQWSAFRCGPARGLIDVGCWVGRAGLVKSTPWRDHGFLGDGTYFEDLCHKAATVRRIRLQN